MKTTKTNKKSRSITLFIIIFFILCSLLLSSSLILANVSQQNNPSYLKLKELLAYLKRPVTFKIIDSKSKTQIEEKKSLLSIIQSAQKYYLSNKMEIELGILKEYQIHLSWALEHESDIDNFYKNDSTNSTNSKHKSKEIFISKLTESIANNKIDIKELLKPYLYSINAKADFANL
ncbi:MAG: hypothetical protein HQK51_09660 [Oligoflexia bacterium]|nr:hypothetical protein [Oligoflexia bacterium]